MIPPRNIVAAVLVLAFLGLCSQAISRLDTRTWAPRYAPNRTLTPLTLHNTYTQPIESARLWAFALDGEGKVVGQRAIWLNGEPGEPWLEADAEAEFNVVLRTTSEAVNTQVVITRIILADGTVINPQEGVAAMPEQEASTPSAP